MASSPWDCDQVRSVSIDRVGGRVNRPEGGQPVAPPGAQGRTTTRSTSPDRGATRRGRRAPSPSRLWQAVTPEPHWCTGLRRARRQRAAEQASNSLRTAALLKRPSAPRLSLKKRLSAPGMWPAFASSGSTSPRKRSPGRASTRGTGRVGRARRRRSACRPAARARRRAPSHALWARCRRRHRRRRAEPRSRRRAPPPPHGPSSAASTTAARA